MIFPQDRYCIVDNKPCASEQLYCSNNCKLQDTKDQTKTKFNTRKPLKTRLITSSTVIKKSATNYTTTTTTTVAASNESDLSKVDTLDESDEEESNEFDDVLNFKHNYSYNNNEHDILEDGVFSIENVDNTHTYPLPVQSRSSISSGGYSRGRRSTHGGSIISTLLMPPSLVSDKGFDTEDDEFDAESIDDELLVQWNCEYITDDEESNNNNHWLYTTPYSKKQEIINNQQKENEHEHEHEFSLSFGYDLSPTSKSKLSNTITEAASSYPLPSPSPISFKTIQDIMSSSDSSLDLKPQLSSKPTAVASNYEIWLNKIAA